MSFLVPLRNSLRETAVFMMRLSPSSAKTSLLFTTQRRWIGRKRQPLKSWPNDFLPFEWKRPEKIPGYFRGGDQEGLTPYEPHEIRPKFALSSELKNAPKEDITRTVYTHDHLSRRDLCKQHIEDDLKKLGLCHSEDLKNSLEGRIVYYTWSIRHMKDILSISPDDRKLRFIRTNCNNLINKRAKELTNLCELHEDRYRELITTLKIEHKIPLIGLRAQRIERKRELRRKTKEYCDELYEKKVDEFIKSIKREQEEFEEEKKLVNAWIKEQHEFLGITVTDNPN